MKTVMMIMVMTLVVVFATALLVLMFENPGMHWGTR